MNGPNGQMATGPPRLPPLPPGWQAQWDQNAKRHVFIDTTTGRPQFEFPRAPAGQRPRHGAHASISGPIQHPQTNNFHAGNLQGQKVPTSPLRRPPNIAPIPPFNNGVHPQQQQQPNQPPRQPQQQQQPPQQRAFSPPQMNNQQQRTFSPPQQPQQQQQPPRPQQSIQRAFSPPQSTATPPNAMQHNAASPPAAAAQPAPAPAPARTSRRQYAAGTAQYVGADVPAASFGSPQRGPAGHGRSQSTAFFSPGLQDAPAPSFHQPAMGPGPQQQPYVQPGMDQQPQFGQPQAPMQQPQQNLVNQFGQMGINAQKSMVSNTNLVGLPLNPAELFAMEPPPINLPPNASFSESPYRNAHHSYKRSTLNAIPTTNSLLNKSKLPLALVVTPYRSLQAGDDEVPTVSDTVIARCRRCRTYINPYVTFIENGARWKCCMCNLSNEVPQMFDWDQEKNEPADRYLRAELNHSVVEFVAPTEYMVRPPQPPIYVFLIDVSYAGTNCGMVATAARTLLESLDRIPNQDSRTKVAIIAFDSALHFFSLPAGSTDASMLVVGDLDDVFLPKPSDILVNLTEARGAIENLLGRLNDMFKESHNAGNAMGAALQAALKLVSAIGGKIVTLCASLPNIGPGALKMREDPKLLGTAKESTLLQPQTPFYKSFAIECSRSQVSVDMWLFSSAYTDVATLSGLPRYTGGQTYFYPSFNAARPEDALKFAHEFATVIADPICLEAVMRVRASRGIRASAFHGNFFVRSTDLLALPSVPMDQSYAIELQIEDPINAPFVVLQTAVLHTTSYGERRIRVITLALPTTSSISELYASADTVAMATLLADKAVERSMQSKLEDARDAVINKMVDILGTYRATMTSAGSGPSAQLVIAENMKFLPLLLLGLMKHVGLRQSSLIPSDLRAYAQALLTTLPSQVLLPYLHPVLYSLHNMPPECGTIGDFGVILPPQLPPSSERLERHGLFLIEDGQNIFLWVGRDAVPQLVMDVFNLPSYADLRGGKMTLPQLENKFSERVNAIIGKVRESRRGPYYPHLYVVKEDGEPSLRQWALSLLIEDRIESMPSYPQWIGQLKDKVNDGRY